MNVSFYLHLSKLIQFTSIYLASYPSPEDLSPESQYV